MNALSEQLNRKDVATQRWSMALLTANVVGAVIYVLAASHGWVIPQERAAGLHSVTGEPFVWALYVLPICIVFLVLNVTWGAFILVRKQWRTGCSGYRHYRFGSLPSQLILHITDHGWRNIAITLIMLAT